MTPPPRSLSDLGLSKRGLVVRLAAIALLSFIYKVLPTLFSSAPAYEKPWDETLWVASFIALVVFGLGFLARGLGPRTGKAVNKGLTIVLAIPIIAVLILVISLLVFGMSRM